MKTHIEVTIRLKTDARANLHTILGRFARESSGWMFASENSREDQQCHGGSAGFVVRVGKDGAPFAAVAIASADSKRPNVFD